LCFARRKSNRVGRLLISGDHIKGTRANTASNQMHSFLDLETGKLFPASQTVAVIVGADPPSTVNDAPPEYLIEGSIEVSEPD